MEEIMRVIRVLAVALLTAIGLAQIAGCASTPTARSTGEVIDDTAITARVKKALIDEPEVNAASVNVTTYRGVVQLSGFVDSEKMARRALEATRSVSGVRSVKDDMHVKPQS
jgi:hyperosmotically inducible protein